jgi:hypothetical protein
MEAFLRLVPGPDFKSGGGCGDTSPAGSIPVRFRHIVSPMTTFTHRINYLQDHQKQFNSKSMTLA